MPFGNRKKNIFEDLFSSVLLNFKKYHLSENLKFNNLGIFQSVKLRNVMQKILRISLKLNFTSNTYGLFDHVGKQKEKNVTLEGWIVSFWCDCREFSQALMRLTRMIRGIGDPLVAVYARCYLCRVGMSVSTGNQDYFKENFYDFLAAYNQVYYSPCISSHEEN